MTEQEKAASPEFMYLPLGSIIVEEQIRSSVDTEGESFKALMASIKDRGVLEPVLVTPKDGKHLLLCGERRYLAVQKLGLESIPALIVNTITQKDEILAYQLTENLQREDLNPMDQAKGILAYIQARHPDKGYDVEGVMSGFISYDRSSNYASEELSATFAEILKISGKSTKTLYNGLSLLKLSDEMQAAIRAGNLPVSQGYLFAANLDCPDLAIIFQNIMKKPVTYPTLQTMLTAYKKAKPDSGDPKPIPMTKQVANLRATRSYIEMGTWQYTKPDLEALIEELRTFLVLAEQKVQTAPEPEPEKPVKKPQA